MASNQQWFWLQRKRKQDMPERRWGLVQTDRTMLMYHRLKHKI